MCRWPSARGRVDAGLRADNHAVSAANPKAAQWLRDDHCGIKRAPSLSRILLHAKQSMLAKGSLMRFLKRLSFIPVLNVCMTSLYAQDVHYNYDRSANFGAYKTYQWVDISGPGLGGAGSVDRSVHQACGGRTTRAKSLTRVEKGADLHVGYHAIIREEKGSTCRHLVTGAARGDGEAVGADSIVVQLPAKHPRFLSERCS